ncbi:hypothetical protein HUZ36_08545 [Pseudoalteromonas sp. McH1-7]|uniref:hypothetical protein n=1 Tax=Pseudoalteromonas TaxID=53246 RepID=UPI001592398C|nr:MULTISPECIES: hypothetical protein [Pseudoalteromonas]MDW7550267.1 hypothetical protein [Pseudoalteromonas peptidolytica]NUZ10826.1 hypothetical protein [Pseudoalteromonas sp. McH1-7]USD28084.1 hypothetical protein J8Z24_14365 [Pseudoalteromonas sp. SCSIO 43201]
MFQRCLFFVIAFSTLAGCASKSDEPVLVIEKQSLHKRQSASGEQEFAFIVTVEATPRMELDSSKPVSRRELKRFAEFERIEDSPALKLKLEEQAVALLKPALASERYCGAGYKITDVYWRQRSVQLRGQCL